MSFFLILSEETVQQTTGLESQDIFSVEQFLYHEFSSWELMITPWFVNAWHRNQTSPFRKLNLYLVSLVQILYKLNLVCTRQDGMDGMGYAVGTGDYSSYCWTQAAVILFCWMQLNAAATVT